MCGYQEVKIPLGPEGHMEYGTVERLMDDGVAGLMVTNPNTLGLFESELHRITEMIHQRGGLVYGDGANLNAVMGRVDLGRLGIDAFHVNTHKTLSTPHGGGGPGAGPVVVGETLEPYLPGPRVVKKGDLFEWDENPPLSIGRLHSFHGQFRVLVRAYAYILSMGPWLKTASELAVLNANYVKEKLKDDYDLPFGGTCTHECVFTDAKQAPFKVSSLDVAKRLIDLGFHPPTIYFPLVVNSAIMIEPTETETKEELDSFIAAMRRVAREARENPDLLRRSPQGTFRRRLDEVEAARHPILTGDSVPKGEGGAK
jgi:glycine dehydrogenase subunit 2